MNEIIEIKTLRGIKKKEKSVFKAIIKVYELCVDSNFDASIVLHNFIHIFRLPYKNKLILLLYICKLILYRPDSLTCFVTVLKQP